MLTGHLLDRLPDAVRGAPAGATVVVFHTAVLPYVPSAERVAFTALVRELPVRWIALAWTAPHGGRIDWFAETMVS